MNPLIKQAAEHWQYIAPLLTPPANDEQYNALVDSLDELIDMVGDDETHPLATLMVHLADLLEAYDQRTRPMPVVSGAQLLRYLMREHQLKQSDLPELGTQSVVSEILSGKRVLNVRQIAWLSTHFGVPAQAFFPARELTKNS